MIMARVDSILTFNLLIISWLNVTIGVLYTNGVHNYANSTELGINKSQQNSPTMRTRSRRIRGIYYKVPVVGHEYDDHLFDDTQYIYKLIAPPTRKRDIGIKELLLVLAPLTAIPLIGSAALTTFTAMVASGGYGGRRKRDLLTQELLSGSFTEVEPKFDHYISHRAIGGQHNTELESLLRSDSGLSAISANAKRQTFPEMHLIATKIDTSFASQTEPKSQVIGGNVSTEERNNWRPIDTTRDEGTDRTDRTGGTKSPRIMSDIDDSLANEDRKHIKSLVVNGSTDLFLENDRKPTNRTNRSYDWQRNPMSAIDRNNTNIIHIRAYPSVDSNNKTDVYLKKGGSSKSVKAHHNFKDITKLGIELSGELKSEETQTFDKRHNDNNNNRDEKSGLKSDDRFQYNTWIPFLSNPHLLELARSDPKSEIHELDIIQKYLNSMGRPDYNDEIIASYLSCNGMLSAANKCLERLTCQFSDPTSAMKPLEKDVSALVIYSLLKNEHIDVSFKSRLQRAAHLGKDNPAQCLSYSCPKNSFNKNRN